jgi:hypothetical protein
MGSDIFEDDWPLAVIRNFPRVIGHEHDHRSCRLHRIQMAEIDFAGARERHMFADPFRATSRRDFRKRFQARFVKRTGRAQAQTQAMHKEPVRAAELREALSAILEKVFGRNFKALDFGET